MTLQFVHGNFLSLVKYAGTKNSQVASPTAKFVATFPTALFWGTQPQLPRSGNLFAQLIDHFLTGCETNPHAVRGRERFNRGVMDLQLSTRALTYEQYLFELIVFAHGRFFTCCSKTATCFHGCWVKLGAKSINIHVQCHFHNCFV